MELSFYRSPLRFGRRDRRHRLRKNPSTTHLPGEGERGEFVLAFALGLVLTGVLLGGLLWVNKHYELKTKELLEDFQRRWNELEAN
jgi:hypothetical protein